MLATEVIIDWFIATLKDDFVPGRITGLTTDPVITRFVANEIPEPYVWVFSPNFDPLGLAKDDNTNTYEIRCQVVSRSNTAGELDQIMSEIARVIPTSPTQFPDFSNSGFEVSRISRILSPQTFEELPGARFQIGTVIFEVDASFVGLPQDRQPVQLPSYTFTGFADEIVNNQIEMYDSGTITGATTYPSNNNGWDFTSASYAKVSGTDGTLNDNVLTVGSSDDNLGLINTINYEFNTDTSDTTSINTTTTFPRIRSLRFGAFDRNNITASDVQNRSLWNYRYGTVDPNGERIEISAVNGQYLYIMFDHTYSIINILDDFGTNNIANFTTSVIDGWRIYILNRDVEFPTFNIAFTLS